MFISSDYTLRFPIIPEAGAGSLAAVTSCTTSSENLLFMEDGDEFNEHERMIGEGKLRTTQVMMEGMEKVMKERKEVGWR